MTSKRQNLIDRVDKDVSRFIRLFHADRFGVCTCVTCGYKAYWKGEGFHNGHFVPKGKGASSVRYILHNMHPQCGACNTSGGPMNTGHKTHVAPISYTQYMIKTYGEEFVDDLKTRKFQVIRYSDSELEEIGKLCKEFANELERDLII